MKKVKCQSGVEVLQEKKQKKQYRLFLVAFFVLLEEQNMGTWKMFWLRKVELADLYNEGS